MADEPTIELEIAVEGVQMEQEEQKVEGGEEKAEEPTAARAGSPTSSSGSSAAEVDKESSGEQAEKTVQDQEEEQPEPPSEQTEEPAQEPEPVAAQEETPAELGPEPTAIVDEPAKEEEPPKEEPEPAAEPELAAEPEPPLEPAVEKEAERTTVTVTLDIEESDAAAGEIQPQDDEEPKPKPAAEAANGDAKDEKSRSPSPGAPTLLGEHLRLMQVGVDLRKVKKSKTYERVYKLDEDLLGISWNSRSKRTAKARIPVSQIKEVRSGRSTDTFKAHVSAESLSDEQCFSIVYVVGGKFHNLDLVAMTSEDAVVWVDGLKCLIADEGATVHKSKVRQRWLRDLFSEADKNGDGTLDLKEVLKMMKMLNIGISPKILKRKFKEADSDGNVDGKLDFEEFCSLFKELASRPEIKRLFYLYGSKNEWLTASDLQKFLETEQGMEDPSQEYCAGLINRYEPTDEGKAQCLMSIDGFTQLLLGPECDIFNQEHGSVYQDMAQPLSHYYIASSHNTYLLEDQLRGPSSVEAYIRALRKGCRCVELDCWDGDNGEPVVYHGHTLTSKILFKDVISAVQEHAFAVSPYPVILSIENHCSISQQHVMAQHMEEILGELLYKAPITDDERILPSPENLKYKILVKGKKLKKELEDLDNDEGEVSDEDEAADIDPTELKRAGMEEAASPTKLDKVQDKPAEEQKAGEGAEGKTEEKVGEEAAAAPEPPKDDQPQVNGLAKEGEKAGQEAAAAPEPPKDDQPQVNGLAKEGEKVEEGGKAEGEGEGEKKGDEGATAEAKKEEQPEGEAPKPEEKPAAEAKPEGLTPKKSSRRRTLSFSRRQRRPPAAQPSGKKIKLSSKLSKLVNYVQSIHFDGFRSWEHGYFSHMSSFSEPSAMKHSSQSSMKFTLYNKVQLSRIYPAGRRVDSSNYDPVPMWNCGCQIVALNYQTAGKSMDWNDGKFLQNGRCGYVLKPDIMREDISVFDQHQKHPHVSGVVPQVLTLKLISGQHLPKPEGGSKTGEVIDPYVVIRVSGIPEDQCRVKSKTVNDNGFNPVWNETFQFLVHFPDLALIRFTVKDKDWGPNQDDFIGSFTVPFASMVPGYRHIHLTSKGNKIENASLFVHVEIQALTAGATRAQHIVPKGRVKKVRDYPTPKLVDLPAIDEQFVASRAHLHRAVDLKEDYVYAILHFKETCGRGAQALLKDCIEIVAARAKGSRLSLCLDVVGDTTGTQVYKMCVSTEGQTIPNTLAVMIAAFNALNIATQALLTDSEQVATELEAIYSKGSDQQAALKEHLQQTAAPPKKVDQVMEHYHSTMSAIKAEANLLQKTKEQASANLQKMFVSAQLFDIELKTSL